MSDFDINEFLGSSIDAPVSPLQPQVPAGKWTARIADLNGSPVDSWVKPPTGNAKSPRLEIPYVIVDDAVAAQMGRSKPPTMTQSYWLNVDSANRLDTKNNAELGQLFAAVGVTTGGIRALLEKLPGAGPFSVTVAEDKKPDKNGNLRMRITKVEAVAA